MRIGLCDDNQVQLNYIQTLIFSWMNLKNIQCHISTYISAEEFIFEHPDTYPFDLLILDIQMGNMNGMELAKNIRATDPNIMIIFLTGLEEYVYEGYEVGALRYLLKPVNEQQLMVLLDESLHKVKRNIHKWYIFTYNGDTMKLNHNDIVYIEARGHYVDLVTTGSHYEIKRNISQLFKDLGESDFFCCHRSYIVNLNHVEKINKSDCVLSTGVSIPVSRGNYSGLNKAFIHYYRRKSL